MSIRLLLAFCVAGAAGFNVAPLRAPRASAVRMQVPTEEEIAAAEESWKGAESWSSAFAEPEAIFDVLKVKEILPHRYPFLLVDKVRRSRRKAIRCLPCASLLVSLSLSL